ncbi:2-dehydropantoate 2-reductase family [Grosmannia clavigera kw1407]|uniref:2-dehydropantoate 2-reductase n=1 Tax=Grosmannia clavigera (strain kw1407 / UAMH 11150) TaxID=655863 RepID=F0XJJ5_GROCL|nr:2-dehydropantoate 2-reductase family [Grosmannia clavigera kw1407]EFX02052.1 2-dehydropantoate 2-reductase family [Grosmannia clavigera kw1407]
MPLNVLIVGCGAVGTMCAFALHQSGEATVTALLRSNYDEVRESGLHIRSVDHGEVDSWRPHHIVKSIAEAKAHGPFDYVLVALKNLPDVYSIADMIAPVVTASRTAVVLVQNGIGIEAPVAAAFPDSTLLSAVSLIGAELDGREVLHNDSDELIVGVWGDAAQKAAGAASCKAFAAAYSRGAARCDVVDDMQWYRWRKLVWNASFNTVCALLDLDSGTVQDAAGSLDSLIRPAMREVVAVAAAAGFTLPDDVIEAAIASMPKAVRCRPSMQVDAVRGRPMEVEAILGNAVDAARDLAVPVPVLQTLCSLLRAKQWAILNKA